MLRRRTGKMASLATRFNRMAYFGFNLVFWSRIFRSQRSPIPIELPLSLLNRKDIHLEAPVLHVSGLHHEVAHWDDGFAGIYAVLFENLQPPDVLSAVRYAHPAPAFRGVYLWDSAFISQVWKAWDRDVAHDIVRAVIDLRDGDRLQHVVSDLVASAYTQPPLIAWALQRIWEGRPRGELNEYLEPLFEALAGYNRWLYENRRLPNGLFFWAHPYESGVENAPRFSSRDESVLLDTRGVAAPDISSYVVLQNEALAAMAEWLDRDGSVFTDQAETLREQIRGQLWSEEDGFFYDRNQKTGEFVRSRSIASLFPLWAGAATDEQARRLLAHVLDESRFNTLLPLPSMALDDREFSRDMWRGPVWLNTAFGVIQGLKRYGFEREASSLAFRLCDGVYRIFRSDRRFYEFYDPTSLDIAQLHRKKGNRWKAFTLGVKPQPDFVGWTGLVNTLVIEQLFGFHWKDGRRYVQPRFPEEAVGKGYSLRLPSEAVAVDVAVLTSREVRVSLRTEKAELNETRCAFGEAVAIDKLENLSRSTPLVAL